MPLGGYAPLPLRLGGSDRLGITAQQLCRLSADLAAVKRTGPLATVDIQVVSSVGQINSYYGMNGTGPAVTDISPSISGMIVTFEPVWIDPYEIEHPINIKAAVATQRSYSGYHACTVDITAANVVRCRAYDNSGGSVTANIRIGLKVW